MLVSPTCFRWTEVSGHSFCNVVVWRILEQLRDLFHIFAWAIVRRDAPRVLVRQGEMRNVTVNIVARSVYKSSLKR